MTHDDLQLQILPGPQIALTSRGALVASVPALPLTLPARPPADGPALWAALPEPVRAALTALAHWQATDGQAVPLWLDLQVAEVAAWPWERLAPDLPGALPFSRQPASPLVRFLAAGPAPTRPRPGVPRLLAIAAAPRDQATLDLAPLEALVRRLHDPQRLSSSWHAPCGPRELPRLLATHQPDILLVVAHGQPGALLLQDRHGDSVAVPAAELAAQIAGTPVRALILASCDGATVAADGRSLAETLLAAGPLGLVAMAGPISADAATTFCAGLLDALVEGQPLEVAVVAGRKAIVGQQGLGGEWAVPVCWQRALHRPLVLTPTVVVRQGATSLTRRAGAWATPLAAGGALGLLAVASLTPLLNPLVAGGTLALPALIELLNNLGLNIFADYLGDWLKKVWRETGADRVTPDATVQKLQRIVQQHADAAAELAALAEHSGATAQLVAAIRAESAGSQALLRGLDRDLQQHGAALNSLGDTLRRDLAGLSADMRQGLRILFQQGNRIELTTQESLKQVGTIKQDTTAILAHLEGDSAKQQAQTQIQRDDYLRSVVETFQRLRLLHLVEQRSDQEQPPELYLQHIYTALTTNGPRQPVPLRRNQRRATVVRRSLRRTGRCAEDAVPPGRVRYLEYLLPPELRQRPGLRVQTTDNDVLATMLGVADTEQWTSATVPDEVAPDTLLSVRLRRPELIVEAMAPQDNGKPRRLVLLGDPGSGKSTALRYLAVLLAESLLERRPPDLIGWSEPRVPILLSLGSLSDALERSEDEHAVLWAAIEQVVRGTGERPRPALAASLERLLSESILLFDGLDELSAEAPRPGATGARQRVAHAIRTLAHELPRTPIVVTCRVRPYRTRVQDGSARSWQFTREDGWDEREVQPFALGQVRSFVEHWYQADASAYGYPEQIAARRASDLLDELKAPRLRQAIAPAEYALRPDPPASPLLLTMLAVLHARREGRSLPRERDELYEELVKLLLYRWEPNRSVPVYDRKDLITRLGIPDLDIKTLRDPLHSMAYKAHCEAPTGGDGRGIINQHTLTGELVEFFQARCSEAETLAKVKIVVAAFHDEAGLLTRLGDNSYALPHLTFQEYLAACHLARHSERAMVDLAYRHWSGADADRWREVVLLLMGRVCQNSVAEGHGGAWLDELVATRDADDRDDKPLATRQRDALLAADCFAVLARRGGLRPRFLREQQEKLRRALQSIIPPTGLRSDQLHLPPVERARAAVALAGLGTPDQPADTRPGVCALPRSHDDHDYWCGPFAAGTYAIGTQPDPFNNKTFQAANLRLETFRIGRYPVTVWQYRQFVAAGGYQQEQWWTKEGWRWLQPGGLRYDWQEKGRIIQPYLWDELEWTADNQPVIGVSWYEALAFCAWLSDQLALPKGWSIRLPTEAEWEVAAMWDAAAGRMRSWTPPEGELWQNVAEAGIGRTCAVGLFPQGASPCGALDMAGNVWEWCMSSYEAYPDKAHSQPDDYRPGTIGPAVRGGTSYTENARSGWGARVRLLPRNQGYDWSFRVIVCSSLP